MTKTCRNSLATLATLLMLMLSACSGSDETSTAPEPTPSAPAVAAETEPTDASSQEPDQDCFMTQVTPTGDLSDKESFDEERTCPPAGSEAETAVQALRDFRLWFDMYEQTERKSPAEDMVVGKSSWEAAPSSAFPEEDSYALPDGMVMQEFGYYGSAVAYCVVHTETGAWAKTDGGWTSWGPSDAFCAVGG